MCHFCCALMDLFGDILLLCKSLNTQIGLVLKSQILEKSPIFYCKRSTRAQFRVTRVFRLTMITVDHTVKFQRQFKMISHHHTYINI